MLNISLFMHFPKKFNGIVKKMFHKNVHKDVSFKLNYNNNQNSQPFSYRQQFDIIYVCSDIQYWIKSADK